MAVVFTFNDELEPEIQTDKDVTKDVPCLGCGRRLVVNTFYAPAKARCAECKGGNGGVVGAIQAPVPGKSDPAQVTNLERVLINRPFTRAVCPVHPDDEEHEMELKSVSHSEHWGPNEFMGYVNGRPEYRQLAPGETVMHQCLKCKATVAYSTTAQVQFGTQNRPGKHVNGWIDYLGVREEKPAEESEAA